jgi:outer membrane murein-binding lipoprotein Lpp
MKVRFLLVLLLPALTGCAANPDVRALCSQVSDLQARVAEQDARLYIQAQEVSALQSQAYHLQQGQAEDRRLITTSAVMLGAVANEQAHLPQIAPIVPQPSQQDTHL